MLLAGLLHNALKR